MIQKEASGKRQVKGIPWEELKEGKTITKPMREKLYGCLCRLKAYEDLGMNPDQLVSWWYELEDMIGHVCDDLCHYRREAKSQEDLDVICECCQASICMSRLLKLTEG